MWQEKLRKFSQNLLLFRVFKSFENLEEDFCFCRFLSQPLSLHGLHIFFVSDIAYAIGLLQEKGRDGHQEVRILRADYNSRVVFVACVLWLYREHFKNK